MFYLLNFTLYPNNTFHVSSPVALTLQQLCLFLVHLQKDLLDAVEKLARMDLHPFQPRPHRILYISPLFSLVSCLGCCRSLLLLLVRSGAAVLARGLITLTLSQLYAHFSLWPHLPLTFPENLSNLLCNQISCLQSCSSYFPSLFKNTGRQSADSLSQSS